MCLGQVWATSPLRFHFDACFLLESFQVVCSRGRGQERRGCRNTASIHAHLGAGAIAVDWLYDTCLTHLTPLCQVFPPLNWRESDQIISNISSIQRNLDVGKLFHSLSVATKEVVSHAVSSLPFIFKSFLIILFTEVIFLFNGYLYFCTFTR